MVRFAPSKTLSAPLLAVLLSFGLSLPFLAKPVHVDDANFLMLAQGAELDPWRPHAIPVNWQGTLEPAFQVLSNPPGIGWWLAPVIEALIWVKHLWMLPWLLLALWGAGALGKSLADQRTAAMLLLGSSPVVLLASQALTPDMPLMACALAGLGGFWALGPRAAWGFGLLTGCAVLFRYSGLTVLPLLLWAGWSKKRLPQALAGFVPLLALVAHDLHAYGDVHLLAMTRFQSVANAPRDILRKGIASLAMLGGAGLLPLLGGKRSWVGATVGAVLGGVGVWISSLSGIGAVMTVLSVALGGGMIAVLSPKKGVDRWLMAWGAGGLIFLLSLRFSAARYWLPFLPALAIAALRLRPGKGLLGVTVGLQAILALLLSVDDQNFAQAQQKAAEWIGPGPGSVSGHWGWQYHMQAQGWTPLNEDTVPLGRLAVAETPWPQPPDPQTCLVRERSLAVPDQWPGPRVHSSLGAANLHAYVVAGEPPLETYAPWSWSNQPYERVALYHVCLPQAWDGLPE